MINLSATEFQQFSTEYRYIPLVKQVLADLDTPLSCYLKLADGAYSYLLESVQGGEKWGRYSIIGLPCRRLIKVYHTKISVIESGTVIEQFDETDPLTWITHYQARYKVAEVPGLPRFTGGLVGYFGYDTVRYVEPSLAAKNPDTLSLPDILLMVSNEVVVFDNLSGQLYIVVHADVQKEGAYEQAVNRLDGLSDKLDTILKRTQKQTRTVHESDFVSAFEQHRFEQAVAKIKQYIVDGDTMQVVLSQRMSIDFKASPLDLYRALRVLNPSPYMFYLNLGDFYVVGSSPEILVHLEDDQVTVRPIAGTRPRGEDEASDLQFEKELLNDPKELAEHLMLIDLGRNDVGRVAQTGSVRLTEKMAIERYSHVMHIVSNVTGKLKPGYSAMDVLRATFPAGTLSGAPKIRAMQIIDELEPISRGIYGGAVGYIGWHGNMDTAIAIRTAIIKDNQLFIQVGAGIVADSIAANEWQETLNKGRAIFRAVAMAESGV